MQRRGKWITYLCKEAKSNTVACFRSSVPLPSSTSSRLSLSYVAILSLYLSLYVCVYILLRSPYMLLFGFLIFSSVGSLGFHLFSFFLLCFGPQLWFSSRELWFWCNCYWRWRPIYIRASLLVILKVSVQLKRRTLAGVYGLLLLLVEGWRSALVWLRKGIMVALVVIDWETLMVFLLGGWSTVAMVYGLVQLLVGATAIGRREMERSRLRHGGTSHGSYDSQKWLMNCNG